ncbi:MAG TPA: potassium channel family protein [Gemmatimonas sp.]|nr:potassium channel family protein [Gemmatimonas sp.]
MSEELPPRPEELDSQRLELLQRIAAWFERPMTVLAFVWLVLVVVEFTAGLSPFLNGLNIAIWALFVLQFVLEFIIAPRKVAYLRHNWLTAVSLLLPALRVVRIARVLRAARAARGVRLVRVVTSANRGMRTLGRVMGRRGLAYVLALTLLVNLLGAAGVLAFEREVANGAIAGYGSALWWTAMTLTTMGADYFPLTPEGRVLGLLLAIYGFAVFGYVTASIASFFVARDAEDGEGELAGTAQIAALRDEVATLSRRVEALLNAPRKNDVDSSPRDRAIPPLSE